MENNRPTQCGQAHTRRRHKRAALTAVAACLLIAAFLCAVKLLLHVQIDHAQGERLWPGDDHLESGLILAWFASDGLAMVIGRSLHSPARQVIYSCAAITIALAMIFCFFALAS